MPYFHDQELLSACYLAQARPSADPLPVQLQVALRPHYAGRNPDARLRDRVGRRLKLRQGASPFCNQRQVRIILVWA